MVHSFDYQYVCIYNIFNFIDPFINISLQPSGDGKPTVGQNQEIVCLISVPPNLDPDTVEFGWLNEEGIIANNSRAILYTSNNNNTLVIILQFDALIEKDEGEYICYAVMNGSLTYETIDFHEFTSKQLQILLQLKMY